LIAPEPLGFELPFRQLLVLHHICPHFLQAYKPEPHAQLAIINPKYYTPNDENALFLARKLYDNIRKGKTILTTIERLLDC
jgi:hypothetical protein